MLRDHLASCPDCRDEDRRVRATLDLVSLARLPRLELPPTIRENLLRASGGLPHPDTARPRPRLTAFVGASAALLVAAALVLGLHAARSGPEGASARLSWTDGQAFVVLESGRRPLVPGAAVPMGSLIQVRGSARFDGEGVRTAVRDAELTWHMGRMRLLSGDAAAEVAKGTRFSMETPQARVEVLGTRFHVRSAGGETLVSVFDGAVRFSSPAGSMRLQPGESGLARAGAAPALSNQVLDTAWAAVLSPSDLFLDLVRPSLSRPWLLEFRISNVGSSELVLPAWSPDFPRFALRISTATPGGEGLVNLAPFRAAPESARAPRPSTVLLRPGETWVERFDAASILEGAGATAVSGVYQSPGKAPGEWTGRLESRTLSD